MSGVTPNPSSIEEGDNCKHSECDGWYEKKRKHQCRCTETFTCKACKEARLVCNVCKEPAHD